MSGIQQWQIDLEVKNVGKASPFYGQQTGAAQTPSVGSNLLPGKPADGNYGNTAIQKANTNTYNPFGANPSVGIYPGGQGAFVPSMPSVTQMAGYNPYGPSAAKTTLPAVQTHQSPDATMARIVNTIDQYKDQISRMSQNIIDQYSQMETKPTPVRTSVLPPSRTAQQQNAFSATAPLLDMGSYKRAGVGSNAPAKPQTLTQAQRTALSGITSAPKKAQMTGPFMASVFGGYGEQDPAQSVLDQTVLNTASQDTTPRSHVYASPEYGYTDKMQFAQGQGLHGYFGDAYDVHPLTADRTKVPIVAVKSGNVVFSGDSGPVYGNVVVIQDMDNPNLHRVYSHQSSNAVKTGDSVWEGQILGNFGATGSENVTGPHLHYETVSGGSFNPQTYQFEGSQPLTPAERTDAFERFARWYGLQ